MTLIASNTLNHIGHSGTMGNVVQPVVIVVVLHLKVARKLVIIESDLERTEERAELSEG